MVKLLDLIRFDVVFETAFVVLAHEIAIGSVKEDQVVNVVRGDRRCILCCIVWFQSICDLADQFESCLCLAFHEEDNAFGEHFVCDKFLLPQFEMIRSLKIVICFIKVLLLNLYLCNFIQSRACQVIVIVRSDDLLKIQDSVAQVVQLLQSFSLVKVCFA